VRGKREGWRKRGGERGMEGRTGRDGRGGREGGRRKLEGLMEKAREGKVAVWKGERVGYSNRYSRRRCTNCVTLRSNY
jgi:hypothetical protein